MITIYCEDDIEKYIRKFLGFVLLCIGVYMIGAEIMKGQYDSRPHPPIRFYFDTMLWIGTFAFGLTTLGVSIKIQMMSAREKNRLKKITQDIIILIQYIGVFILRQVAKSYRPSKLQDTTDEYAFWLKLFWLALLWLIAYIIIVAVVAEVKKQNEEEKGT